MSSFRGRDVLSIRDFTPADIQLVLRTARKMVPIATGEKRSRSLEGKILSTLFYEPSTRTRLSFESAMARLGGRALGFSSAEGTSVEKGETLADTIRMVEAYSDARDAGGDPRAGEREGSLVPGGTPPRRGDPRSRCPLRHPNPEGAVPRPPGVREGRRFVPRRHGGPASRETRTHHHAPAAAGDGDRAGGGPHETRGVLQTGLQRGPGPHGTPRPDPRRGRMRELRVTPIKNGTVIDHIPAGLALKVLKILGIGDAVTSTVTVAMHVPSQAMGWKDIVKVEDRELGGRELEKIALIAPTATVNVIRNYNVAEKRPLALPDWAVGILRCANPNCISNVREPIESSFVVRSKNPLRVVCKYCDRELEDIVSHIL